MKLIDEQLIIFDGAVGTNIQALNLPASVWGDREGCTEYLNITAPQVIIDFHSSFIEAGAMVFETNTFGASSVVLAEYGLEKRVREINQLAVKHARQAIGNRPRLYVAGSIGPTSKLPSLGHISVDQLAEAMTQQADSLVAAGVDALILETCQDMLQLKTTLIACLEVLASHKSEIPVFVSVTFEQHGTMLVGTDIAAVAATLEPFPIFSLGLNCATGPEAMASHIHYLGQHWPGRISCIPNQGLPEVINGNTVYPLKPQPFAQRIKEFVINDGVSIVGGCCGTTPEHIKQLVEVLNGVLPKKREISL